MGGCAWHLLLHVASVACSALEPLARSLMLSSSSIVASWWRHLCLFLPTLASSSAPKTVAPGDASPPLLGADRSHATLELTALWVPTPHRSSAALCGGTSQRVERSQRCPAMCATDGRPCQRLPRVTAGPPSPTELIVARFRARCSGHLFA
jgi:hypothetical protein